MGDKLLKAVERNAEDIKRQAATLAKTCGIRQESASNIAQEVLWESWSLSANAMAFLYPKAAGEKCGNPWCLQVVVPNWTWLSPSVECIAQYGTFYAKLVLVFVAVQPWDTSLAHTLLYLGGSQRLAASGHLNEMP